MGGKCLLTASHDKYIRIWTCSGGLLGNLNVNYPLPV